MMNIKRDKSNALHRKAAALMPLGVNSNFRYWGDDSTPYVEKAKGGYLWDVDGNRYIDYRMAFGPIILGHAYDEVDAKVIEEIQKGLLFAMTSELEISLAEKIIAMCPCVEMVRLACSGTEATMHALRVARAYTGREKVIKFEGMYHGFHDYTLFSTYAPVAACGNRNSPIPIPSSSGIPKCLNELIIPLPFNDLEVLDKTLRWVGHQVAAIIVEPCMGNCAAIEPAPGFLEFIREKCTEYGIVFILDEVKTGFRVARGGAQELFGIVPDLATYAKSLGNGYPIAALGGKREIMDVIGKGVAQGGTFNNNKCGVAAAYATLDILQKQPILETIARRGRRLMDGLRGIFEEAGIPASVHGYPAMLSFAVGLEKVNNQREWAGSDHNYYLRLMEAAYERGVMPDYDPREPWFLCYSHSDADIDETLNVMQDAVRTVKR
jgi:glutamate-1-semialdehyde 2,1-aminomutase